MPNKRKKEKNTANPINVDGYILVPRISMGIFKIGEHIDEYKWVSDYMIYRKDIEKEWSSDSYVFKEFEGLTIYVDDYDKIESINVDKYCCYNGIDLIGYNFKKFKELINQEPYDEDFLPVIMIDGKNVQNQHVYEFDDLGLQVWVRYNKIISITCSNYIDANDDV